MHLVLRSKVNLKRAYEGASKSDGRRILVDRMWPRGLTRTEIAIDEWIKGAAPSAALRKWFNHSPRKWREFKRRYFKELKTRPEAVKRLLTMSRGGTVTLVFGAKDARHNNAVALKEFPERRPRGKEDQTQV